MDNGLVGTVTDELGVEPDAVKECSMMWSPGSWGL